MNSSSLRTIVSACAAALLISSCASNSLQPKSLPAANSKQNATQSASQKSTQEKTQNTKLIKIAANLPLTGNLSTYGAAIRDGATLALEDLKQTDPNGPLLVVDWQDNAGNPKSTVSVLQRQFIEAPDIYMS